MINTIIMAAIAVCVISILFLACKWHRRPRPLAIEHFQGEWQTMQKLCAHKETWPQAIIDADKILDEALRRRRFPGKSMGERLTKAQRDFTNNESVWFGHKLRNKVEAETEPKLKEKEVKRALIGIRQALKDLGAFSSDDN
jgi:hypothetical protein